jgi:putative salt-induced outer membrane protein YdiY
MAKRVGFLALTAAVLACTPVLADTISLKSGDNFTGTITKITPTTVEVDTTFAGKIIVKRDTIKTLRSEERVAIVGADGATTRAFIAPVAEGSGWLQQESVAPPPPPPAPVVATVPPAPPGKVYDVDLQRYYIPVGPDWKNTFSVGIVNTTGNTESTNIAAEVSFKYDVKPLEFTLKIGGVYDTTEGKQTAGQFYFDAVVRRALTEWDKDGKWYFFGENHELYDAMKDLSYRITNGAGLGYYFAKDPKGLTLDLRAGPAYVCEKFFDDSGESYISALVGLRALYVINDRFTVSQEVLYTVSLEDARSYQIMAETAALVKLPEVARGVGMKFAFRDDYDNATVAEKRNDTRLTLSLTLDF